MAISLDGTAGITTPSIQNDGLDGVGNIGTSATSFNTVFAKATSAQYADVAEKYIADSDYEPGTVLIFAGHAEVTQSTVENDTRVAGVVSTNPAYIMNSNLDHMYSTEVALLGRVPCKVTGAITKGDLLVTSEVVGHAKANNSPKPGTIIGRALVSKQSLEAGVIEIVVQNA